MRQNLTLQLTLLTFRLLRFARNDTGVSLRGYERSERRSNLKHILKAIKICYDVQNLAALTNPNKYGKILKMEETIEK